MRKAMLVAAAVCGLLSAAERPKVRAITAFVKFDAARWEAQVGEAVKFLEAAREEYKAAGFEVETIRVVPQPLADYTRGMKHADALTMLRRYDEVSAKAGFRANMGAIMVSGDEDRAVVRSEEHTSELQSHSFI